MAQVGVEVRQAKDKAEQAQEKGKEAVNHPAVQMLVRLGYVVRGVLYGLVGLLALQLALHKGGGTSDKKGVLEAIAFQPFGHFLLLLVVVGLVGYSVWGFVRAIIDPLNRGNSPGGIAQRVGYIVSGLTYGSLIFPAIGLLTDQGAGGGDSGTQKWSGWLLHQPMGQWLLLLVGVIATCGGLGQIFQGVTAGFKKDFKLEEMTEKERELAITAGRIGMAARGVVFAIAGFFLIQAALRTDPGQAKGLDAALATLAQQPYGSWLLGVVAAGLIAFGIFSIMSGRWIRTNRGPANGQKTEG